MLQITSCLVTKLLTSPGGSKFTSPPNSVPVQPDREILTLPGRVDEKA
jgi:hypothetical protein